MTDPVTLILHCGTESSVSLIDLARLVKYRWYLHKKPRGDGYYVRGRVDGRRVLIHNFIMGEESVRMVDHKDGNGLNNTRENLRIATPTQNGQNRKKTRGVSQFKGVTWARRQKRWMATICINRKNRHLGYFKLEVEAAEAYNRAASKHFGEFANLNNTNRCDVVRR